MKKIVRRLAVLGLTISISSCLPDVSPDKKDSFILNADLEKIEIPADVPGTQAQQQSIEVSSNRSWSAFFEPEAPWISLSVSELENIAQTEERTEIVLTIDNNENPAGSRETNLVISTAEGRISIPVKQGKQIPYISLSTPSNVDDISCMDDSYKVKFTSNISWKACIEEGATAQVSIDKNEGKYDGEVTVSFAENEDAEATPEAVLVLSGEESGLASPVKVYFKQGKASPYIRWISEEPTYQGSQSGSIELEFKTNSSWQAALENAPDGVSLSATSGSKDIKTLKVLFGEFYGPGSLRSATVVLSLSNGVTASLPVHQFGTELYLDFIDGNQPFTTDISYGTPVADQETEYLLSCNGKNYEFTFYSTSGYTFVTGAEGETCGLMTFKNDWVKLPAVEGMKLKSAEVYTSNMGSSAQKGFALRETPDGANLKAVWVAANSEWCKVPLPDPVVGQRYYLVAQNNTGYFSKMRLVYEQ